MPFRRNTELTIYNKLIMTKILNLITDIILERFENMVNKLYFSSRYNNDEDIIHYGYFTMLPQRSTLWKYKNRQISCQIKVHI